MDNGMSLSDIAAVTRDNDGMGAGGAWWVIILLLALGGGLWGGNRAAAAEQPVTEAGLCNAMNFNNLENAVGRLNDASQLQFTQVTNGMANMGYENMRNFAQTQQTVQAGNYELARQLADCCCTTQRAIDGVNYNGAMNTAAINANTTAVGQKVLDAIQQNKIESLQAKVNELETRNMFCGIPRISPYGYGVVPNFAGCGCTAAF